MGGMGGEGTTLGCNTRGAEATDKSQSKIADSGEDLRSRTTA